MLFNGNKRYDFYTTPYFSCMKAYRRAGDILRIYSRKLQLVLFIGRAEGKPLSPLPGFSRPKT